MVGFLVRDSVVRLKLKKVAVTTEGEIEKICPKCGHVKAGSDFYRNRSQRDGLGQWCKLCWNAYTSARWKINLPQSRKRASALARAKYQIKNPEVHTQRQHQLELRSKGFSYCNECKEVKPLDQFHVNKAKRGSGISSYCYACDKLRQHESDAKRDRTQYIKAHYAANKEAINAQSRDWRKALRAETFRRYGGHCQCCGESTSEFLCIDHINGGGVQHRKAVGRGGTGFYSWLRKQGYPDGYQVLCHNCNESLGYWGYCPHQVATLRAV